MQETRIIIAGSRDFDDLYLLESVISNYIENLNPMEKPPVIISGCAKGADKLGECFAVYFGYKLKRFPADWDNFGKSAGPIRNEKMAKYAVADNSHGVLFAFWDGKSKGTKNMIDIAEKYSLEVHVIRYGSMLHEDDGTVNFNE